MANLRKKITLIDCNNFWSKSGGGVRRFHLEKLKKFERNEKFIYVFIMHDNKTFTEQINESTFIEHICVRKVVGNWDYRFLLRTSPLKDVFEKYNPDIIECGSPYVLPWLVKQAIKGLGKRPLLTAFWHADFPVTYVERIIGKWNPMIGKWAGGLAWKYAAFTFRNFDAIFVSSEVIARRMSQNGLQRLCHAPLGIDTNLFHPSQKSESKITRLKSGEPGRLTVFYAHRFCEEKGLRTLLEAWPEVVNQLKVEPALIMAGTGPDLPRVQEAVKKYKHMEYIGFVGRQEEMTSWYASCELGFVLSGWETFSLSLLEAMASGQVLITADTGAAAEHMQRASAGLVIPTGDAGALAEAIIEVARGDKGKLRGNSKAYAESFTWQRCFDIQSGFYNQLVENKNKGKSLEQPFTRWED